MLGKILGDRYELIEKIGSGGMAIVYKAKCSMLKKFVAVKILRPDLVEDEDFVRRFKRESQAVSSLSHDNIVNVYDVGEEEGIYYIVMEYVEGCTLKEYIKKQEKLDYKEAVDIALQICSALKNAHMNKIVHRDIKPQNILVGKDNKIKVADFGIARAIDSSTVTMSGTQVIGSVHYFSPEQARGNYVDCKSDIYSLGVVLYEMVTGKLPFEGDSAVSVSLKHIQDDFVHPLELNPNIPKSLPDIIMKALEKKREDRYEDIDELIGDLERSLREPNAEFVKKRFDSDNPTLTVDKSEIEEELSINNRKSKIKKAVWLITPFALVLFILTMIGISIYKNNFTFKEVKVPSVVMLSEEDAKKALQEKDLIAHVKARVFDEDVDEGYIISQRPEEGMTVKTDTVINLVISKGPETAIVPDLIGQKVEEAELAIENIGLNIDNIKYEYSDLPIGTVISQSIREDTEVVLGAQIILVVSKGPETIPVRVGNYVGYTRQTAEVLIKGDGLEIGEVFEEYSDDVPVDKIIKQNPKEGDMIEEGSEVTLWLSLGPAPSYPKQIVIDISDESENSVKVNVKESSSGIVVYNAEHDKSKGNVIIELNSKGIKKYEIYLNNRYIKTITIDFTKKEDES